MQKATLLLALATGLGAQTPVAQEFMVKPSIGPGGGGTRVSANRVIADDASLRLIIALAYETTEARVDAPGWTAGDRYDVVAATGNAGGPAALLRQKLSDAFGVDAKKESRTVPVYVLGSGAAPKLPASTAQRAGFRRENATMHATAIPVGALASYLERIVRRPVIDETGIEGPRDFTLRLDGDKPESIVDAVREQLGLEMTEARKPVEIVVVERVHKLAAAIPPLPAPAKFAPSPEPSLTAAEAAAGWWLLFDGKTTAGWRGFRGGPFPTRGWVIRANTLQHLPGRGRLDEEGGDLVTADEFENFELQLEWAVGPGANSGILFPVSDDAPSPWESGFEMQVLDDARHPDALRGETHQAAALYDLIAPRNKKLQPVGEFNKVRLVVRNGHVEHWFNGEKVVEYDRDDPEFQKLVAASKFKSMPFFARTRKGHISLQDHGSEVAYRNIKVRLLK